ncbi:MAG: PKD domain-containing protein [Anaerolineae bacterium]|nr:PKD domain-containing protein [Anaerolineae bacterium]
MQLIYLISMSSFQSLSLALGLALWQQPTTSRPMWLTYAFLIALILTLIFFRARFPGPGLQWLTELLSNNLILIGFLVTTALFFVLLFNLNPLPYIRQGAETMGLGQLVNFDTAFAHGLPDAVSDNIGVVSVMRADTDADGFEEWVVFYLFDKRARNSPIHGAVYDNDRGKPPVIFPYQLQAPDRNYLSEQQTYGPSLTIEDLALDRNGPDGADVPELIVQGADELTVFRFRQNSEAWEHPRDTPARYQPIGFFRGSGGVSINLIQGADAYGQVTVIDRNGFERSQLAIRSVYGLITGPDGNQTYLDPIPPLGGVGGPQLAAPILSTVDFYPTPPNELFNTPFPEKLVLGFYAATCGGADETLCNTDTTDASLLWRPDNDTSLSSFLMGDALAAFNANNPGYFGLPAFDGNSGITVAQLRYYPQTETDPDLLETGGGRDVVTGEQGQVGLVHITFNVNGSALQEACYQMQLTAGQWKILRRLTASCAEPPPPPTPTSTPLPPPTPLPPIPTDEVTGEEPIQPLLPKITAPATASVCESILFSAVGSEPAGQLATYDWDFGDGNTGSGLNLSYRYAIPGVYNVTLTVRDNIGQVSPPATHTITINPPASPPPPPCGPPTCCG